MRDDLEREWNERQLIAGTLHGKVLAELVRHGARVVQDRAGDLVVDGLAGPATISEIESYLGLNQPSEKERAARRRRKPAVDLVPVPSRRGIETVYGSFSYKSHPEIKGALLIDKAWIRKNIVKVICHTGQHTWMHRLITDEFRKIYKEACEASGYTPKSMWSWVARRMRWSDDPNVKPSLHSWGIAVDFDPALNAWGKSKGTAMRSNMAFVDTFERHGWSWGGRWKDRNGDPMPDDMHFERVRRS